MERAQRSADDDTLTIVIAEDDAGRWVGLAGGYRPGDRGAEVDKLPSDTAQQEIRMLRGVDSRDLASGDV